MKFKKLMAAALTTVMVAGMLTGCGDKGTAASGSSTESKAETKTEANAGAAETTGDVVTINVTRDLFNLGSVNSDQVKKVETAINEYIKDKINVQINLTEYQDAEYSDKANLALNNKEINLLWTASWRSVIGTNDLAPLNAVYDLTDIVKDTPLYNSMDEGQWEAAKYDGKILFVPVYKDNVEGYDLIFRKELVDKYGWDVESVKTLEDLEPMLADCKAEGIKYPFLTQHTGMFFRYYIDSFDFFTGDNTGSWIAVDRKTNEVVDTVLTPEYKEYVTLMSKWGELGYIHEDEITKTTPETTTQTQDWGVTWWTDLPANEEASNRYKQDIVVVPFTNRYVHSTSNLGSCYCVSATSTPEEAKACVDFLGLLFTDTKLADMYTFGIEGEDFEYKDGFVVQHSDAYNHSMWESAHATIVTPVEGEPANKAELYEEFNGSANTSCAAGFRFNKGPVEAKFKACQNLFDEYGHPLENGAFAVADVDKTIAAYQAALDEAGYQDVLAEFQAQYDAWKK